MTELTRLTKKIHQLEDKIKDSQRYIDRVGPSAYGYKNECKKLARYTEELEAVKAEYDALPKLEDVPVIKKFVDKYGERVLEWIENCHEQYPIRKKELSAKKKEFMENHPEYVRHDYLTYTGEREFNYQNRYLVEAIEILREGDLLYERREDYVERDKELKYIDLVEKVKGICGTITDASCLRVGEKGELNGYIDGDKGSAKVQTFGAGGFNIQRFHYRTKVTKIGGR